MEDEWNNPRVGYTQLEKEPTILKIPSFHKNRLINWIITKKKIRTFRRKLKNAKPEIFY